MKLLIIILMSCLFVPRNYCQNKLDLEKDAKTMFEKKDKELNDVYQKLLSNYKNDTIFLNSLRTAQRIWLKFRDSQLRMKYPVRSNEQATVFGICEYNYLQKLTSGRIMELKEWLEGVEEGDICAGSIKISNHAIGQLESSEYLEALKQANIFLMCWLKRDAKLGIVTLSEELKKSVHDDLSLQQYFSGLSNPHHQAFTIIEGYKKKEECYVFSVVLSELATGEENGYLYTGSLEVIKENNYWRINRLPKSSDNP